MTKSSLAAIFDGPGRPLRIESLGIPQLESGEALVQIECCTLCGSDLHTLEGRRREVLPTILGHEVIGRVVDFADFSTTDVRGDAIALGDRVTWSTIIACGSCDRCRGGLSQKCRFLAKYGHERAEGRSALSGGLAEFLLLRPGSSVARIAPEIAAEVICPANCATATAAAICRVAGDIAGRRVLIFGAGMLGLTATAFSRVLGADTVVVCDPNPERLKLASRFGSDAIVKWSDHAAELHRRFEPFGETGRFDLIFELSGAARAVEAACAHAAVGGTIVLAGAVMPTRSVMVDPESVVRQMLTIRGVHNYGPDDLRVAVEFLHRHASAYPWAELVANRFPLSHIHDAVAFAVRHRPVRVAVYPQGVPA